MAVQLCSKINLHPSTSEAGGSSASISASCLWNSVVRAASCVGEFICSVPPPTSEPVTAAVLRHRSFFSGDPSTPRAVAESAAAPADPLTDPSIDRASHTHRPTISYNETPPPALEDLQMRLSELRSRALRLPPPPTEASVPASAETASGTTSMPPGAVPTFDELAARFAALQAMRRTG